MNAAAGFFRKYHAVPATNAGPQWHRATDAALLGWFNPVKSVVRCGWNAESRREATTAERREQFPLHRELLAEVRRRAALPDASPEIMGACFVTLGDFPTPLTLEDGTHAE